MALTASCRRSSEPVRMTAVPSNRPRSSSQRQKRAAAADLDVVGMGAEQEDVDFALR